MRRSVLLTFAVLVALVGFALAGPDAQAGNPAGCAGAAAVGFSGEAAASCAGSHRSHGERRFRPLRGLLRVCGRVASAPFRGRRHHATYSYSYQESGTVNTARRVRASDCPSGLCPR